MLGLKYINCIAVIYPIFQTVADITNNTSNKKEILY